MIGIVLSVLGCSILAVVAIGFVRAMLHRAGQVCGDVELAAELGRQAGRQARRVAAIVIDLSAQPCTRMAFIDAGRDTPFEIGSVTKGLTGMLLAEAVARGETSPDTMLAALLPETATGPLGSVTLRELCTHTSGLPRLPRSPATLARVIGGGLFGVDPYRGTAPAGVVAAACRQRLTGRGRYRYSNLGASVLGHALARAAGCDYATLLARRVFASLGMTSSGTNSGGCVPRGWRAPGRRSSPWRAGGYGPAGGGVFSTAADIGLLATALIERSAPGHGAIEPIAAVDSRMPHRSMGMFWIIDHVPDNGRTTVWHNGQTGGYSAFLALYPQARRAVAVLADVADAPAQQRIATGLTRWLNNTANYG